MSIGLAMVRRDRFVSQTAGDAGGYLLTREFIVEGEQLRINAAPSTHRPPNARFSVEVIRLPDGRFGPPTVVAGYSHDDCDAAPRDLLDHHITWQGKDLGQLRGQAVQLRFYLRNMRLYALQLSAES